MKKRVGRIRVKIHNINIYKQLHGPERTKFHTLIPIWLQHAIKFCYVQFIYNTQNLGLRDGCLLLGGLGGGWSSSSSELLNLSMRDWTLLLFLCLGW